MSLPVERWLKKTWPSEKKLLKNLPFVVTKPIIGLFPFDNTKLSAVSLEIKVDMPAKGPVCDINDIESICFLLGGTFPNQRPLVLVRHDFPPVVHLGSRKGKYRMICLTRREPNDWWCGKTFVDIVKESYEWLCDAAAGKLIKEDDPFEPLIASGTTPVELNIETAKRECSKHNGSWKTTAKMRVVKNGSGTCFIVGKEGEVPTQVWYQEKEQIEPWIDPPSCKEELLAMMARVGFDEKRIEYWIDRGKIRLLLVVGVKRGREVLGRLGTDEWVAFELKRKKAKERCPWNIETHLVLERFAPLIAALTSGFQEQTNEVVIIGGGALGSEVCESLARSGIVRISLIDNDTLQPHNLARHTLMPRDIGDYKADALARKLNSLFEKEVCTPINKNFLDITSPELDTIAKNAACIIDCSASIAVQLRLGDGLLEEKPLISAYQIDAGCGTVVLYSPAGKAGKPYLLEAILATKWRNTPIIANWFKESGEAITIGGGCSSITSQISSSIIKLGAGWISDKILRLVSSRDWPEIAYMEMLEYDNRALNSMHLHRQKVDDIFLGKTEEWKIWTPKYVIDQISQLARSALPNETGGVIIGRLDKQRKMACITEAWKAPIDSKATRTGFSRGLAGLKNKIAMLEKDTNEYLSYVGEWHSHPPLQRTDLSSIDTPTAKRMARELEEDRIPAVCLVTNSKDWRAHIVEQKT